MVRQLSDEEISAARAEVRAWMKDRTDVTAAHIAQYTTIADCSVRGWIAGRFPGGVHVTINMNGHVYGTSGVHEFLAMVNDAVLNQGATLTATNTTTGRQIQQ